MIRQGIRGGVGLAYHLEQLSITTVGSAVKKKTDTGVCRLGTLLIEQIICWTGVEEVRVCDSKNFRGLCG